jgi:hypothetical protein
MFSTSVSLITCPTSDRVVWTRGDSPETVMVSLRFPTAIVKSALTDDPTCTMSPLRSCVEKPWISAVTSYVPAGSASKWKVPVLPLTAVRVRPVAVFLAVSVTPGIAPFCWSKTRPSIAPVSVCAYAWPVIATSTTRSARPTALATRMKTPFPT